MLKRTTILQLRLHISYYVLSMFYAVKRRCWRLKRLRAESQHPCKFSTFPSSVTKTLVRLDTKKFRIIKWYSKTIWLKVMWLIGWEPFKVSHQPGKFGFHRPCGSGDIMVLVWHVILQYQATKGLINFVSANRSRQITILLSLVATDTAMVEI